MDRQAKLSPHFTIGELIASDIAARKGIDNTPSALVEANLARVAGILEAVRALNGRPVVVSSGYRCKALNTAVGGADNSAHMYGLAADINAPGVSPYDLGLAIIKAGIKFDQIIHEFGEWVHIAVPEQGKNPRGSILTIKKGTGYMTGWLP